MQKAPRLALSLGLFVHVLPIVACEVLAGLEERAFVDMRAVGGAAALPPGTGGSPLDGGEQGGGAGVGGMDPGKAGSGGASSSGAGGTESPSGGTGGTGGTGEACVDVTSKLCMRPPWPDGVIPFDFEPEVPGWVRRSVHESALAWEGLHAGSSTLHFMQLNNPYSNEPAPEAVPKLLFAWDDGCGPVLVNDEAITVEIASCSEEFEIAMVIGAALGLPRFHQRADRDRYLEVAPASAFPCGQGRSREICSPFHGMPAQFGTFGFDSDRSVMWPHPRVPGAPGDGTNCGLEPEGRYLFLARHAAGLGDSCAQMESSFRSIKGDAEIGAIAELYALGQGWSPFVPVGADLGPEVPIQTRPRANADLEISPVLVATEGNRLAAFSFSYAGQINPWMIENDGDSWGPWEPILEDSSDFWLPEHAVLRPQSAGVFDFVQAEGASVHHATYDRVLDTGTFQSFGSPDNQPILDAALTTDVSSHVLLYVAIAPVSPELDRVFVTDFDGSSWSDWQPLPVLEEPVEVLDIATAGNLEGERHVMLTTSLGYRYTRSNAEGAWDDWTAPALPKELRDIVLFSNETFPLAMIGKLRPFEENYAEVLWLITCTEASCADASAWTTPLALGAIQSGYFGAVAPSAERIDIVTMRSEFLPGTGDQWGMRHKRWRPLPAEE